MLILYRNKETNETLLNVLKIDLPGKDISAIALVPM